jgi:hypothetical protein
LRLPDFAADGLADLPVKLNQGGVDGLYGALAGGADERGDFAKVGLRVSVGFNFDYRRTYANCYKLV